MNKNKGISIFGIALQRTAMLWIVFAAIFGLVFGFYKSYTDGTKIKGIPFDSGKYLATFSLGKAIEGCKKCIILNSKVQVMQTPSNLTENVLLTLNPGNEVEYIETVDSFDKNYNQGALTKDVEIFELLHRNIRISQGTVVEIVGEKEDDYVCSFEDRGRTVTRKLAKKIVRRAYTGSWQKIKVNGQEGFIKASDATGPKFM